MNSIEKMEVEAFNEAMEYGGLTREELSQTTRTCRSRLSCIAGSTSILRIASIRKEMSGRSTAWI